MGLFRKETAVYQGCAGCAILGGVVMSILGVFMFLHPTQNATRSDSLSGFAFGAMMAIPGLITWLWLAHHNKQGDFRESVLGMIRNHERFTTTEMAKKIGRTELQTERLIAKLTERNDDLHLVFHRPTQQYLHRSVVEASATIVDTCPKCGAPQGQQVILQGEQVFCTHCEAQIG